MCVIGLLGSRILNPKVSSRFYFRIADLHALLDTQAFGKGFVECCTQQRLHNKTFVGKGLFVECLLPGTRQRLCRVSRQHSAKKSYRDGAEQLTAAGPSLGKDFFYFWKILCRVPHARHSESSNFFLGNALPSAPCSALGKALIFFFGKCFAECPCSALGKALNFF
jgi:hypothetical protein